MDPAGSRVIREAAHIAATGDGCENLLLAVLPASERRRLLTHCESVELAFGDRLCEQGRRIRHVYFPTGGFISLISSIGGRARLEVGLVGWEGMLGVSLRMGVRDAPLRALVQGAGPALRIDATEFSHVLTRSPVLRQTLTRYLYVLMSQLAQMAACTRFHVVEARLARWLLMMRDRAGSNESNSHPGVSGAYAGCAPRWHYARRRVIAAAQIDPLQPGPDNHSRRPRPGARFLRVLCSRRGDVRTTPRCRC